MRVHSIYTSWMTKPSKVDLVGVGLNATDTLIALADYPARGSKVEYRSADVLPGGQVATAVVACQHWGMSTRYVGILGDDAAATLHQEAFARAGVETQIVTVKGGASPQSLILVDGGGERTVLCRRDARVTLKPAHLDRQWIVNAQALHVDGYDTAAATVAAGWARAAGIPVIADLDELYPGLENLLENVDYLIVSRDIPSRLTGEPDLEMALRLMQHQLRMPSHRGNAWATTVCWLGMESTYTTRPLIAFRWSIPPALGISSTPGLSTDFFRIGPWNDNSILGAPRPQ